MAKLCRRKLDEEGIFNVSDQTIIKVNAHGKGSARKILDAVVSIVLNTKRANQTKLTTTDKEMV